MEEANADVEMDELLTRNRPEQDDTVIYLSKGGKAKLGVVTRIYRGVSEDNEMYVERLKQGEILIDVFPGANAVTRKEREVCIVDRGFTLSESVVRAEHSKQVGFVKNIHVKADVVVLPERKIVARNVDLRTAKFTEPFAVGGQNYLLFDDWVGSVKKSVFELTLSYKNYYRCRVKDNVSSSLLYRKKDYGATRQWIPGEVVMVCNNFVLSKKVEWETELPPYLKKRMRKGTRTSHSPFTIEKVSLHTVKVRWITTPSASLTPPPERITKPEVERVIKLDTLEYTQAVCGDRMRLFPDDSVTVVRKTDWEKSSAKQFLSMLPAAAFDGVRNRRKNLGSSSSSSCSGSTHVSSQSLPIKKRAENPERDTEETVREGVTRNASSDSDGENGMLKINVDTSTDVPMEDDETDGPNAKSSVAPADAAADSKGTDTKKKEEGGGGTTAIASPKPSAIPHRLSGVKKNKPTVFTVRQIRRNKQMRPLKRKAETPRVPLDMRACLGDEFYGEILCTRSVVDVIWMDGTVEHGISGTQLIPYELDLDQHDHVPGAIVAKKGSDRMESEFGVVLSADAEKRLALIQWYKYDWVAKNIEPEKTEKEECSLFDLILHPNYHRFWWGSLCLRTSIESENVKDLIGQLISSNDNGKNTVSWFNGKVEEVWPVEITNLLTNEEMDAPPDEEDEDESWHSFDNEGDDTLDSSGASLDSGISVVFSEANPSESALMPNARIFLPKELIHSACSVVEFQQQRFLSRFAFLKPPRKWLNSLKGKKATLLEVTGMMTEMLVDYMDDRLDHEACMESLRHLLRCMVRLPTFTRFSFDEFFFSLISLIAKADDRKNENVATRHMERSFAVAMVLVEDVVGEMNPLIALDSTTSGSSEHPSDEETELGIRLVNALFAVAMRKLESVYDEGTKGVLPFAVDEFLESPFFSAIGINASGIGAPSGSASITHLSDLSSAIASHFSASPARSQRKYRRVEVSSEDTDTDREASASRSSTSTTESMASAVDGDPTAVSPRVSVTRIPSSFSDATVKPSISSMAGDLTVACELSSLSTDKPLRCIVEVESLRVADQLMPALCDAVGVIDSDLVRAALARMSKEVNLHPEAADGKPTESGTDPKEVDEKAPLADISHKKERVADSCASALSAMINALLYDTMRELNFAQLFTPYVQVESHIRSFFVDYWCGAVDGMSKEVRERVSPILETMIETWHETSFRLSNVVKERLTGCLVGLVKQIRNASSSDSTDEVAKKTDSEASITNEGAEVEGEKATDTGHEEMVAEGGSDGPPAIAAPSQVIPAAERLFPALEFDDFAPSSHAYFSKTPTSSRSFVRAVRAEYDSLTNHLPEGIYVKAFQDRLDLLSVVIAGPKGTPFEDVPFFFDVRLPSTYPAEPPHVHYWAYSQEQLNPNLYQSGKVCTSLLGTWSGKGVEQWNAGSNLLQVFLSIQGLILVPEPYYNEAGYESRKNISVSFERSRRYNEMALVNSLDYFYRIQRNPPKGFEKLIAEHCRRVLPVLKARICAFEKGELVPDFPLSPISEGCKLSLRKTVVILGTIADEPSSSEGNTPGASSSASSSLPSSAAESESSSPTPPSEASSDAV